MKRIFEVNGQFFETKKEAKAARGEPKTPAQEGTVDGRKVLFPAEFKHEVHIGPDHHRFASRKSGFTPPRGAGGRK